MNQFSSVPDNWYESFFTAPFNAFWDAIVPASVTQLEVAFIERHLQLTGAAHIVDVPCGSGRHALALTRNGLRVTGIDLSEDATDRARAAASALHLPFAVSRQDMAHLQTNEQFDGAICMGNSFGYLTHADTHSFLRAMQTCLRSGARFIIDTGMAAESILANMKREAKYEMNGYEFEISNHYDVVLSRLLTDTALTKEGETWRQSFSHGVYTSGELVRMLDVHGFAVEGMYADLSDTPYTMQQPRLLVVASRR